MNSIDDRSQKLDQSTRTAVRRVNLSIKKDLLSFAFCCFFVVWCFLFAMLCDFDLHELVSDSVTIFEASKSIIKHLQSYEYSLEAIFYGDMIAIRLLYHFFSGNLYLVANLLMILVIILGGRNEFPGGFSRLIILFTLVQFSIIFNKDLLVTLLLTLCVKILNSDKKYLAKLFCICLSVLILENVRRGSGIMILLFFLSNRFRISLIFIFLFGFYWDSIISSISDYMFVIQRVEGQIEAAGYARVSYLWRWLANLFFPLKMPFIYDLTFFLIVRTLFGIWVVALIVKGLVYMRQGIGITYNILLLISLLSYLPYSHPRYLIAFFPLFFLKNRFIYSVCR